jgi:hypothetical protein
MLPALAANLSPSVGRMAGSSAGLPLARYVLQLRWLVHRPANYRLEAGLRLCGAVSGRLGHLADSGMRRRIIARLRTGFRSYIRRAQGRVAGSYPTTRP